MWYVLQKMITVSTYIDVSPWDLDTMILGYNHTCDINRCGSSGVATGRHGWTMSRDPGAKGAPKKDNKIKNGKGKKKKRKGRKEKREQNFSNTRTGPSPDISP